MNARHLCLAATVVVATALAPRVSAHEHDAASMPTDRGAATALRSPTDSVYRLPVALSDQTGRTFRLDERRGQPMLVSMFYTSCQSVCPMLIDALRDTQRQLTPSEQEHLGLLVVSFDPVRDTVAVLKHTYDERGLDSHWSLARTDAATTRKLAAVLGIQYRALADGDFNHTTVLLLLDARGRIVARTSKLGNADPAFLKQVKVVVNAPAL